MSASRHSNPLAKPLGLAVVLLACALAPTDCRGQAYGVETIVDNNDLRWFEPVELDLDGRIDPDRRGLYFHIEKLYWDVAGERVEIGAPGIVNPSEQVYRANPDTLTQARVNQLAAVGVPLTQMFQVLNTEFVTDNSAGFGTTNMGAPQGGEAVNFIVIDTGETDDMDNPITFLSPEIVPGTGNQPPAPYNVENGILDAAPDSQFAWGERYEIGYSDGEQGWMVGILDGPEQRSEKVYGAGRGSVYTSQSITGFADFDPFYGSTPQDLDGDGVLDAPGEINEIFALGFGSVPVNFEAPEDFFLGFRDYVLNFFPGAGVVTGPIYDVPNYGAVEDDFLDDDPDDVPALADDINGNGETFQVFVADLNGDGDIDDDEIIGSFTDYGDLYDFDVFFDEVLVRNTTSLTGIELMFTHEVDRRHRLDRGRRDYLRLSYGLRYLDLHDIFFWEGVGSVLGRTGAEVDIENQIIGPQVAVRWTRDRGKWDFTLDGRVMFGYNGVDRGLDGTFAQGAVIGGLNNLINARTTNRVSGDRQEEFSPVAEWRAELRYKFSKAIALKAGYTGKFIGNVHRASQSMRYTVPYFSMQEGVRDVYVNGVNIGAELRY